MTGRLAERGAARRRGQGTGRAAMMIGVITILARLVGFGRQGVFAHTVGTTCLGTAYTAANMVPTIIYDIVLGGALSSVAVPALAGPAPDAAGAGAGDAADSAGRIASALLTWTVLVPVPVSAALALAANPIVTVLLSHSSGCPRALMAAIGARMLIVFAAGAAVRAGGGATAALPARGFIVNVGPSVLVTMVVIAVFAGVAGTIDGGDLRTALARLRARPS